MKCVMAGLWMLLLTGVVLAQTGTDESAAASPDHDALRALKGLYEQAMAEDRIDLLREHLHPQFTGVMVTGQSVAGYDELVAYWTRIKSLMGEGGTYQVTVEPDALSAIMGDLALAHGVTRDHVVTSEGKTFDFTTKWSAVCQKVDGQWKLLRIQGTMDPIANPFVSEIARKAGLTGGVIAGIAGLALGALVTLLIKRLRG